MAGDKRSGGQKHIWLIAIDYHTATGTARAEYKETEGQRWPDTQSLEQTPAALRKSQETKT